MKKLFKARKTTMNQKTKLTSLNLIWLTAKQLKLTTISPSSTRVS